MAAIADAGRDNKSRQTVAPLQDGAGCAAWAEVLQGDALIKCLDMWLPCCSSRCLSSHAEGNGSPGQIAGCGSATTAW